MANKIVTFGEVMMRLTTPGRQRFSQANSYDATFGGGEANVAVSLAQFGCRSTFVTALPDNALADSARQTLRGLGVDVAGPTLDDSRLGLYFMETGANQRSGQVVYDRAGSAFADLEPGAIDWGTVFEGANWFHVSGISPAVSAKAADATLEAVTAAKTAGVTVSLDLNHRAKLWQYPCDPKQVMQGLVSLTDVLIAGREDSQKSLGIAGEGDPDSQEYFRVLTANLEQEFPNLQAIAVTIRDTKTAEHHDWAACLRTGGKTLFSRQYEIRDIVDRVGSGDAFAAGLIYGLTEKMAPQSALEFGAAANCLKHSIEGDFNLVSVEEVKRLAAGTETGRVQR